MEGSRPLRATALLFANCEAGGLVGAWVAVNSESDVSAFPRLRARSGRRRGTNRRPRFHATRGLSAAIRPALQLANCASMSAPVSQPCIRDRAGVSRPPCSAGLPGNRAARPRLRGKGDSPASRYIAAGSRATSALLAARSGCARPGRREARCDAIAGVRGRLLGRTAWLRRCGPLGRPPGVFGAVIIRSHGFVQGGGGPGGGGGFRSRGGA